MLVKVVMLRMHNKYLILFKISVLSIYVTYNPYCGSIKLFFELLQNVANIQHKFCA